MKRLLLFIFLSIATNYAKSTECKAFQQCSDGKCRYVTNCGTEYINSDPQLLKKIEELEKEKKELQEKKRQVEADQFVNEKNKKEREQAKYNKSLFLQIDASNPNQSGEIEIDIRTNADTASLKINGIEEGGRQNGIYKVKRFARVGQESTFIIDAIDVYGNRDSKTITAKRQISESNLIALELNPLQVAKQPFKDSVAIIIGISDYKNLPKADFANDDARIFYDYAIRALGIKPDNIKLLIDSDADQAEIYRAFKSWLPSRVRNSTEVYVFYSGHGLPTEDAQGLYLLPQRADRDFIDKTAINQNEINAAIQASKPKSVTIFLDSCYSGMTRTGQSLIANARPINLKSNTQIFPSEFTVITSSKSDQISSSSPELKHGIFSFYLMRGMEGEADLNKDGKITIGEMHTYLSENVSRQAGILNRNQIPQLYGELNKVLMGK